MNSKLKFGLALAAIVAAGLVVSAQEQRPTFHAGISRVSLNVVVKDGQGRPITNLAPRDFEVFDNDRPVQLDNIGVAEESVSIAILIDTSGSMALGPRLADAKQAVGMLLDQYKPIDEAALLTFDTRLHHIVAFTKDRDEVRRGFDLVKPYGATSLHDAIAAAAKGVVDRRSPRRAVVAVTDGIDNASELSAVAASAIASAIDVPIYVLAAAGPNRKLDPSEVALEPVEGGSVARLDDLTAHRRLAFTTQAPAKLISRRRITGRRRQAGIG